MKYFLTAFFCIVSILNGNTCTAQAIESDNFERILKQQQAQEKRFLANLKQGKIQECLEYFSKSVVRKFGIDSLKNELRFLSRCLGDNTTYNKTQSIGRSNGGIGSFGHDTEGDYEVQSNYSLMKKDEIVYHFTLYYDDKEPVTKIKYFESKNFLSPFLKGVKLKRNLAPGE